MNFLKILYSALFTYVFICNALSQQKELDSLLIAYQSYPKTDSVQIALLNKIAYTYHLIDIKETEKYADLAYEKSVEIDLKDGKSRALALKAIAYEYKGEYQKSLELVQEALSIANEIKSDDLKCKLTNSIGILYETLDLNDKAIQSWKKAIEKCGIVKDTIAIAYINSNLGGLHFSEKNPEKALLYFNEVLRLGQLSNNCDLLSIAYDDMAEVLLEQGKLEEAEESLFEALKIRKSCSGEDFNLAKINYKLAKLKLLSGEITEAKSYLDQSNNYIKDTGASWIELNNIEVENEILLRLNNNQQAINVLKKGVRLAKELQEINHEASFKDKLSTIYSKSGNYKEAFKYKSESKILYDSINVISKTQRILDLENKYESEKKETELKFLQEQQVKNAQIIKSRTYLIIASILFASLIGLIALFIWQNLKKKTKYNTQLESQVNERTEKLQRSNEMLISSNQKLERFAYISSHDLKQPLKNIISFSQLIQKEALKSNLPKITEYSNILENCSNQLNTLVSDILDYSKIKSDFKAQDVDLNMIVDQLQVDLKETLLSKNAVITSEELPRIISDKSKMYQAFKNIIENGIKYNESDVPRVSITTTESTHKWIIKFIDNGIGIDPKYHDNIFTMFERLHSKDEYPGSGIGLSAIKTIIEKLNGTISVNSALNQGSEFTITLPKKQV